MDVVITYTFSFNPVNFAVALISFYSPHCVQLSDNIMSTFSFTHKLTSHILTDNTANAVTFSLVQINQSGTHVNTAWELLSL